MVSPSKVSKYIKAGIILLLLGLLVLSVEDLFWDENIQLTLYLIPIGLFFSSFIPFILAGITPSNN